MLRAHPLLQTAEQFGSLAQLSCKGLCLFVDGGIVVGPRLQYFSHFVGRETGCYQAGLVTFTGQEVLEIGEAVLGFPVGLVELQNSGGCVGRRLRDLDQFLVTRQFTRKQGIREDLLQGRMGTRPLAAQFVEIQLVGGCELKKQLHRQRALVALDQVQVAWRDFQLLGHRRLREAKLVANAPDTGTGKNLLFSHVRFHSARFFTPFTNLRQAFNRIYTR